MAGEFGEGGDSLRRFTAFADDQFTLADVQRLVDMWSALLQEHGGPMLFGDFSIADAFYAPVVMRFECYKLPISASSQSYMQKILALASVQQWIAAAKQEQMFVPFDEPYRQHRLQYLQS